MIQGSTEDDWSVIYGPTFLDRWGFWVSGGERWGLDHDEHAMRAVYVPDVNLTVAYGLDFKQAHLLELDDRSERPEWAKFPDGSVNPIYIDVFWAGALIDRALVVSVDGGRAVLPDPKANYRGEYPDLEVEDWTVSEWQVALARVAHNLEHHPSEFDAYLKRAGFRVV